MTSSPFSPCHTPAGMKLVVISFTLLGLQASNTMVPSERDHWGIKTASIMYKLGKLDLVPIRANIFSICLIELAKLSTRRTLSLVSFTWSLLEVARFPALD